VPVALDRLDAMETLRKRIGITNAYDDLRRDPYVAKYTMQKRNPDSDVECISFPRGEVRLGGALLAKVRPVAINEQAMSCRRRFLRTGIGKPGHQVTNRHGFTHVICAREPGWQVEVLGNSCAKAAYTSRSTRVFD
jgi:hypothetical protein